METLTERDYFSLDTVQCFCGGDTLNGYSDTPGSWEFVDWPASYHNGAACFSFADGHSEIHKWQDSRTTPPIVKGQQLSYKVSSPGNMDIFWMMDHSTRAGN